MTDEMIPMTEETAEAGRTFTERVSVTGGELIETVQNLLREAAVRRITIQDKDGRNLLEIPLYAGIAGALVLGSATVLALIAAWFAQVSILIERDKAHDVGPTVVGEAVERAAGSASSAASSAASQVVGGVTAFFGGATRGAGEAARRVADALEARLGRAVNTTDTAAEQAAESADAAAVKVGEAVDTAAEKATETADAAAIKVGEAVGAVAEKVSETADAAAAKAGEVAAAAATKVEGAAEALGEKAHAAADALADMAPERQCAAITKAGTRCKRPAMDDSEFCGIHQVA